MKSKNDIKENQKKKSFIAQLFLLIFLPLIIISIVLIVISNNVEKNLVKETTGNEMYSAAVAVEQMLNLVDSGDYSEKDGVVYKGDTSLEGLSEQLNVMRSKSEVDYAVFFGTTPVGCSELDNAQPLNETVLAKIVNGDYSSQGVEINGVVSDAYFHQLVQPSTGEVVGAIIIDRPTASITKMTTDGLMIMIGACITVAIILSIIIVVIMKSIAGTMKEATTSLSKVATGDVSFKLDDKFEQRDDELGEIVKSVRKVMNSFKQLISEVNSSSEELDSLSGEFLNSFSSIKTDMGDINTAVTEIANGATAQANDTQQATENVVNVGASIQNASEKIASVKEKSISMSEYSNEAKDSMAELIQIGEQTAQSFITVKDHTEATNKSVQGILTMVDLISDIASQTNLLSLNASIEAARAGDAGKGFAVVAEEIRKLAEQSDNSAKNISEIVNELVDTSSQSVEVIDSATQIVDNQNQKMHNSDELFAKLITEIDEVNDDILQIEKQMEEIDSLKNSLSEKMEGLAAIAEENAASTEETSATSTNLIALVDNCSSDTERIRNLSEKLNTQLKRFKL